MNNNNRNRRNNNSNNNGEDEVEQLLQAAQDELLLKISVDSHMSRVSPDYLLPDLDHRFQALKNRRPSTLVSSKPPTQSPSSIVNNPIDEADLLARFAALKASSSSPSQSANALTGFNQEHIADDDEDEVEKIIRWAKDAARLDPSPPSADDDDDDNDDADTIDDSDTTDSEEDDRVDKRKKGHCK